MVGCSSIGVSSLVVPLVGFGKSIYGRVRNIATLDQAYSFQLRENRKARDRLVGKVETTAKVNVANTIAIVDEAFHGFVRQVGTVT